MPYVPCHFIINGVRGLVAVAALVLVILGGHPARADDRPAGPTILILGDSLTAGYGLPSDRAFPTQLQRALRKRKINARIINSGVSGDTTAGGRSRLAWALSTKPDFVIIELGGNDGLRGLDPARTKANLDAILKTLKARGIPAMLTGMYAPPNLGPQYGKEFNAVFPALAKKHGVLFYPFFLDGVAAQKHLNQRDGIHPNAAGVDILVARILPYVLKLIETKPATAQN